MTIGITPIEWLSLLFFVGVAGFALLNGTRYTFVRRQRFPPPWVFGVVWTVLYPAICIAGFLFWQTGVTDGYSNYIYTSGLSLWLVQMALNFVWIVVYAEYRSAKAALGVILLLLLASAACTGVFIAQSMDIPDNAGCIAASVFMGVYTLWIATASLFNAFEVRAERRGVPVIDERRRMMNVK